MTGPGLVLGPLVRGASADALSIWVETDAACEVAVLGNSNRTFQVGGHHYGLVELPPLARGTTTRYTVHLDGRAVWPEPGDTVGAPGIRVAEPGTLRIMAGSCRQQAPEPLWLRRRSDVFGQLGPDALATLAYEIRERDRVPPDLLLLTGDQVYADEQHRTVRADLRRRRGGRPAPGNPEVASFEEYTWLYQQTWAHPLIRWLLATVPSLMIFDDHDVIDDWNISDRWVAAIGAEPWWADRIRAALMAYWVYQHIGNLSPTDRASDEVFKAVTEAEDGATVLAELADDLAAGSGARLVRTWSFHHRTDVVDLVVLDSRNARVLDPESRSMLAPPDWALIDNQVDADDDRHLLVVTSVPWALPVGIHRLQEWISHLADGGIHGRFGPLARRLGEAIRRAIDLEHWPAFGTSYERLRQLLQRSAGRAHSTVVLSGDVHFAYIARIASGSGQPPIHQVVSSPLRQVEMGYERMGRRLAMSKLGRRVINGLAERSRARTGPISFELEDGPFFENNIATLDYTSTGLTVRIEQAVTDGSGFPALDAVANRIVSRP